MGSEVSRPAGRTADDLNQPAGGHAGQRTASAVEKVTRSDRPYPPSWVDRLTGWVRRLPLPSWVYYLAVGLVLSLVYLVLLLPSVGPVLDLNTVIIYSVLNGMTCTYPLALIHYLDKSAEAALARFRQVMDVDDAGYNKLLYQLTTLPARPLLIASLLGVAYSVVALVLDINSGESAAPEIVPPVAFTISAGYTVVIYVLAAAVVYHTLHQLHMVNKVYTRYTHINLFHLGPLYALSGLTARTAIAIGIPTYIWFQAESLSQVSTAAVYIFQTVFLGIMILVTFIWPLLGAHNLLEREKQRLQDEVARRIEATIAALHSRVDNGELGEIGVLKDALDGLVVEQGVINKLRTWPWRTETVSGLGLAFILPVFIWVVQRVLERLGI